MEMLRKKQSKTTDEIKETISLSELEEMQKEVKNIRISDSINELMDAALGIEKERYRGIRPNIFRLWGILSGRRRF